MEHVVSIVLYNQFVVLYNRQRQSTKILLWLLENHISLEIKSMNIFCIIILSGNNWLNVKNIDDKSKINILLYVRGNKYFCRITFNLNCF